MLFNDAFADFQSETHAGILFRGEKWLKEPLMNFFGDSGACIFNFDSDDVVSGAGPDCKRSVERHRFKSISD
jgi:hypothetical protein